jgi:hypothetical protein
MDRRGRRDEKWKTGFCLVVDVVVDETIIFAANRKN